MIFGAPDPDPIDRQSPIHVAVAANKPTIVKKMVDQINRIDRFGWTPLYRAVHDRNITMTRLLLSMGADPDIPNSRYGPCCWTPLYLAVYNGDLVIAEMLLRANGSTHKLANIPDGLGLTPLHRALYSKNYDMVALLLKYGANPHLSFKNELTPFQIGLTELNASKPARF